MEAPDLITQYRDFILSLIVLPNSIQVVRRMSIDNKFEMLHTKMGIAPRIDVDIRLIEEFSRSVKVYVGFDKYEKEYIYYISRHNSPIKQLEIFNNKLSKVVNDTLIENKEWDLLDKLYKIQQQKFTKALQKKKIQ